MSVALSEWAGITLTTTTKAHPSGTAATGIGTGTEIVVQTGEEIEIEDLGDLEVAEVDDGGAPEGGAAVVGGIDERCGAQGDAIGGPFRLPAAFVGPH